MTHKYLFVGDTHGNLQCLDALFAHAKTHDVHTLIQVGDWGYCWPGKDDTLVLRDMLQEVGLKMWFIDGNHDYHTRLRTGYVSFESLRYMPRGSVFTDADGTTFLFCGGAPSIDREHRREGFSWWPEELISTEDVEMCLAYPGKVDILVCHDSPVIPDGFKDGVGSTWFRREGPASRERLATIARHHRPQLIVHGHWHESYTRQWEGMQIVGLGESRDTLLEYTLPFNSDMLIK